MSSNKLTLGQLTNSISFTGMVADDISAFLQHHGFPKTATHSKNVAQKARDLAHQFNAITQILNANGNGKRFSFRISPDS